MNDMKVSVVVPAYNVEKYIEQCLRSLMSQTLTEIEIIVVNDGSTDRTAEIIEKLSREDRRIHLYNQENKGAGPARNKGMDISRGKYLLILDADDYFESHMCEYLYAEAERKKTEILIFGAEAVDILSGTRRNIHSLIGGISEMQGRVFSAQEVAGHIFQMTFAVAWNKFYLRSFVEKHSLQFQAIKVIDDLFFVMLSLTLADRIAFTEEIFTIHRENNQASQMKNITNYPMNSFLACEAVKLELEARNLYTEYAESYLDLAMDETMRQLNRMENIAAFEKIYNFIKTDGFRRLGIDETTIHLIHSKNERNEFHKIKEMTCAEYLYDKVERIHDALGEFYGFPDDGTLIGKKIIIYGAGAVGKSYYTQCLCTGRAQVVLWVDQNYEKLAAMGYPVVSPKMIQTCNYDRIIIAQLQENTAISIKNELRKSGVNGEKIYYSRPERI